MLVPLVVDHLGNTFNCLNSFFRDDPPHTHNGHFGHHDNNIEPYDGVEVYGCHSVPRKTGKVKGWSILGGIGLATVGLAVAFIAAKYDPDQTIEAALKKDGIEMANTDATAVTGKQVIKQPDPASGSALRSPSARPAAIRAQRPVSGPGAF